jgi:hypothetical protein
MAGARNSRMSLVESPLRMNQSAFAELGGNFVMGKLFANHAADTLSIGSLSG